MNRIFIAVLMACLLSACDPPKQTSQQASSEPINPTEDESLGVGMTYSGKLGIEVAPGVIMTTKGVGLGFGF